MNDQLADYIQQQLAQGHSEADVRQALAQSSWNTETVDQTFAYIGKLAPQTLSSNLENSPIIQTPQSKNRVRNGILWILSPFIVLFGVAIISAAFRAAGINSPIVNIFSLLAGVIGVLLVFIGPIVGIVKLASHK